MANIKLLDCTLRDGGYINDWNFGKDNIRTIVEKLSESKIDYVEYGFISDSAISNINNSLYNNLKDILYINKTSKPTLMFNFGSLNIDNFIDNFDDNFKDFELRISFKKHDMDNLLTACQKLGEKVMFSLNPMHISLYTQSELEDLINLANRTEPTAFTAVDTMGVMQKTDTLRIFRTIDKELKKGINLGFHAHDNLNLAKENIITLSEMGLERTIIIDTCLGGLSRGGGIADTVEIAEIFGGYNTEILNKLKREITEPIKKKYKLNDRYPFYLSAKHFCHPNYAKYMIDNNLDHDTMERVFAMIPEGNKTNYSKEVIQTVLSCL